MFLFRLEKKDIKKGMTKTVKHLSSVERCVGNACQPLLQLVKEMAPNEAKRWQVQNEQEEVLHSLPAEVLERHASGGCRY